MREHITFYINGHKHKIKGSKATMMLADYLRYVECQTGTKIVCAEGDCGACSVLRYFPHVPGEASHYYLPFNSCITPLLVLDGSSLVTVDALGEKEKLHASQKAMVEHHASQCGFCTPGFVIGLSGLVDKKLYKKQHKIKKADVKNALTGNLCRCTGYESIIEAGMGINLDQEKTLKDRFYSEEQDTELKKIFEKGIHLKTDNFSLYAPKKIKKVVEYLNEHADAKIIASATDLGVIQNKHLNQPKKMLSLHLIEELYTIEEDKGRISVGARVTLNDLRHFLKKHVPNFAKYLDIFASPQIKNVATLIGNIANASPIGDTAPALLVLDARVFLEGPKGSRKVALSDFFLDYRKINLNKGEVITKLDFLIPQGTFRVTKNSNRKDLDISSVNFAIRAEFQDKKIKLINLAAGGVAATPIRLQKTEKLLEGKELSAELIDKVAVKMHEDFNPINDLRASSAYRRVVMENYFRRFFSEAIQ